MTKKKTPFEECMDIVDNGSDEDQTILLLALLSEKSRRVDKGEWNVDN